MPIIKLNKFSERVLNSSNRSLLRRMARLERMEYEISSHKDNTLDKAKFIFTISITAYNRYEYLKNAVNSVLNQTYKNIEIILVDQRGDGQVSNFCDEVFKKNKNVKLIRTIGEKLQPHNNFRFYDDIDEPLVNVWNAALFVSIGDCIFPMCDDDCMGEIYVEKMVNLFIENENCVTAGSSVRSIDEHGNENDAYFNYGLSRYSSPGYFLKNFMTDERSRFFNAPGTYFTVKSDVLIRKGGWDYVTDWSPIFRFLIYGDFGYDPDAVFYWRHHRGQVHWLNHGCVFYAARIQWLQDYDVEENIEKALGKALSSDFTKFFEKFIFDEAKLSFIWACRSGRFRNIVGVAKEIHRQNPRINIFEHVSILTIVKTYLWANLLELYLRSPVAQKYWRKIKYAIN